MIRKQTLFFFFLYLLMVGCASNEVQPSQSKIQLNQGWKFKKFESSAYFEADVPGSVQLDLMNAGIIADSFFRSNEDSIQWVANEDWEYLNVFSLSNEFLKNKNIEIVFEGLDTYADVYLNDTLILKADNMFRQWKVDISKLLSEENQLLIHFYSPTNKNTEIAKKHDIPLPEQRAFTRKAPYQFGWDWGPRIITSGIWKPIFLSVKEENSIESTYFTTDSIVGSTAFISAEIEIYSELAKDAKINISNEGLLLYSGTVHLNSNLNSKLLSFQIPNAKLWWTNGLGKADLYQIKTELQKNDEILDSKTDQIGIRTIKLVENEDDAGKSFFFELNGIPVFMKGANYIPQDNLLSRVDPEKHNSIIESARLANMNMLRVWGGGIYEDDLFYDLCDENGILVWQDFMFAGSMYPGDHQFLESCKAEITDQIIRLRNHPSIALWCGNNEVDEAWHNWGWQNQFNYSEDQQSEIWDSYQSLFHQAIPDLIKDLDPNRDYWPSSPKIGWGHPESLTEGDSHYWGVWWGKEPFSVYNKKVGRFMSEYGFQSFPANATFDSVLLPSDKYLYSEALKTHEKHKQGFEIIDDYMKQEFKIPDQFEDYAYVSQLLQAKGVGVALEAHRRAKPYCMGTLYWQLNDCWPVISWSSLDYYGNWKALHYEAQKNFRDLMISFDQNKDSLFVHIVSDKLVEINTKLQIQLLDFDGKVLWQDQSNIKILPNSSNLFWSLKTSELIQNNNEKQIVLSATIKNENDKIIDRLYYFKPTKDLDLKQANISFECNKNPKGYTVIIEADKLVKNIYLEFTGVKGRFSENYFDLLPNQKHILNFTTNEIIGNPKKSLKIKSLTDCYQNLSHEAVHYNNFSSNLFIKNTGSRNQIKSKGI
jgi:beta-mannosidase